jgi:hypothetical protein
VHQIAPFSVRDEPSGQGGLRVDSRIIPPRHKQHLAALELQVLLAAMAEKAPGTRPGGEVIRLRSNFLNAIKRMQSGWTKPEQACPHAQGPATDKPSRGVRATQA